MDILLQFTYKPDGASADLFRDRVQRVTLCVYRTDGSIEHTRTLEKNELDRLQGVEMYLPQGTYTVALWANASNTRTKLGGFIAGQTMNDLLPPILRQNGRQPFRRLTVCFLPLPG